MRARIALLEGLKRSSENAAADQKRRIVLLEYALKAERCVEPCLRRARRGGTRRELMHDGGDGAQG